MSLNNDIINVLNFCARKESRYKYPKYSQTSFSGIVNVTAHSERCFVHTFRSLVCVCVGELGGDITTLSPSITALHPPTKFPENNRKNNNLLLRVPQLVNLQGKTLQSNATYSDLKPDFIALFLENNLTTLQIAQNLLRNIFSI